jgi:hypothetical protein
MLLDGMLLTAFCMPSAAEGSPQSLLALFEASCTDGEVADARAWFAVFEKDNPTAVSSVPHSQPNSGRAA